MNKEQFSDALTLLDDDIIEETCQIRSRGKRRLKKTGIWAAAAACLALLTYAGYRVLPQQAPGTPPNPPGVLTAPTSTPTQTPDVSPSLPLLPVATQAGDGMGYEGYMAFNISELVNANPWDETMELTALPVYQNTNPLKDGAVYTASGGKYTDNMQEFLLDLAKRLDLDVSSLTITEEYADYAVDGRPDPIALIAQADNLQIRVELDQYASISFDPPVALPDEYNYTYDCSYRDCAETAEYLMRKYAELLGMEHPQIDIQGGDYNSEIDQSFSIGFYDGDEDDIARIINYNFYTTQFYSDPYGGLSLIWIYRPDLSQKVGDYPVITADAAKELLCAGSYITSVPYAMPGADYIKKVELIYRSSPIEEYFMPYYLFYVELPDDIYIVEREDLSIPLNTYGAYYVPAIDSRYLTGMPVWDVKWAF